MESIAANIGATQAVNAQKLRGRVEEEEQASNIGWSRKHHGA